MNTIPARQRLTIRVSRHTLSFSVVDTTAEGNPVVYEPYTVRSGISMAANLREAFKTAQLLAFDYHRVTVMTDTPVLLIPVDLFREAEADALYRHSYPDTRADVVMHNVLPELNVVAVFTVNKDLKTVVDDHFGSATFVCAMSPVWRYLHQRSYIGNRNKLYGYFHDGKVDVFSFAQRRFKFCNTFDATSAHDALYYLMYVWKQLMMKPEHDELHLVGNIPEKDWMTTELKRFLQRAYVINPTADFNRAPATQIKGMPYDLMTLYVKGR